MNAIDAIGVLDVIEDEAERARASNSDHLEGRTSDDINRVPNIGSAVRQRLKTFTSESDARPGKNQMRERDEPPTDQIEVAELAESINGGRVTPRRSR